MKAVVAIRTSFEATHSWPTCPIAEVDFLRNEHRHVFHVEIRFPVNHMDRQVEFIIAKKEVDMYTDVNFRDQYLEGKSCEMLAEELLVRFSEANYCSVFEDNENGAILER